MGTSAPSTSTRQLSTPTPASAARTCSTVALREAPDPQQGTCHELQRAATFGAREAFCNIPISRLFTAPPPDTWSHIVTCIHRGVVETRHPCRGLQHPARPAHDGLYHHSRRRGPWIPLTEDGPPR